MSRHQKYQKKGSKAIKEPDIECIEEVKKEQNRIGKCSIEFLEADRKTFIQNAIEMNSIFEYRRKNKFSDTEMVTRAKNILQSLVYLVLNDDFYNEIKKIRAKISIPLKGFDSEKEYNDWALQYGRRCLSKNNILLNGREKETYFMLHGYEKVYQETEDFIKKHKLCYAKDIMHLAPIISRFISRRLKFEKFFSFVYPSVYEHALHCRMDGKMCDKFQRGFEINVIELEDLDLNFFASQWSYDIFPFTKLTGMGELFRDFYEREFYSEKNLKDYDAKYLKLKMKKLNVKENKDKIKKRQGLEVIEKDDFIKIEFTTNFFTKPSDIISFYKKEKYRIQKLLASKEERIRKIQKLHLTEKFERNYQIWELQRKGLSYDEISGEMFSMGDEYELGDKYINKIKGELGEFKVNITNALKRKIIF